MTIDIARVFLPVLTLPFGALARLGRMIFSAFVFVVSRTKEQGHAQRPVAASASTKQSQSLARINVPQAAAQSERTEAEDTGPPTMFVQEWDIADRIVTMRLDPMVGTINLRVFHSRKVVKRDIVISEPRLRKLLGGVRRLELADVPYDPILGLEDIKAQTVDEAEELINRQGNERVRGIKPPKADFQRTRETPVVAKAPAPAPQERAAAPVPTPPAPPPAPVQAQQPEQGAARRAPRPPAPPAVPSVDGSAIRTENVTYRGALVAAGTAVRRPRGRDPFEVFDAELRLEDGTNLTLSGAELERALEKQQVAIGDRVAITSMGKVPVQLANGGSGLKNLYKVEVLERKRG